MAALAPAAGARRAGPASAFNTVTEEAVYFDGNAVRCVQIDTLADRLVHQLSDDRVPCGLTGVSPDGKLFVFPHADRAWWEANLAQGPERHTGRDVRLDLVDLQSGAVRTLLHFDGWITHSNFYDATRILFCHAPTQQAILMTDLRGGWYVNLRTPDEAGIPCHYQASAKGLMTRSTPAPWGCAIPTPMSAARPRSRAIASPTSAMIPKAASGTSRRPCREARGAFATCPGCAPAPATRPK